MAKRKKSDRMATGKQPHGENTSLVKPGLDQKIVAAAASDTAAGPTSYSRTGDWRAAEWPLLLGVFFSSFIVYLITLPSFVTMEDSGEFLLSARFLGISHPPGYPLYTMLSHLFTWFPLGTVASRVHFLSALTSAGAGVFLYLSANLLTGRRLVSAAAALAYAFSLTFWYHSLIAEAYSLNTFFFFLILWLALRLDQDWTRSRWYTFVLVYSLSLANHWPLIGLATPGLAILLFRHWRKALKDLPVALGLAVLGLLPYLYIIIRSQFDPPLAFLGPVTSVRDLIGYILREYYANVDHEPTATFKDSLRYMWYFVSIIPREFTWLGAGAMAAGLVPGWRQLPRRYFFGFLVAFGSSTVFLPLVFTVEFREVLITVLSVFQLIPYGLATLFMAFGLGAICDWLGARTPANLQPQKWLAAALGLAVFIAPLGVNFSKNDLRHDTFAMDFATLILESLPKDAKLLVHGDADTGPLAYANLIVGIRPDVKIYTQTGVYLNNRIFDPKVITTPDQAADATIDFILKNGRVFSTKRLQYLIERKSTPLLFHFNGLYYEVTPAADGPVPPRDESELKRRIVEFSDRIHQGYYRQQWPQHRDSITSQLCNYMVLREIPHPLFQDNRDCKLIHARHFARLKNYEQAERLFTEAMPLTTLMAQGERQSLYHERLLNQLSWINARIGSMDQKVKWLQDAVEAAYPAVHIYNRCDNKVAKTLLELRAQAPIDIHMDYMTKRFFRCKALRKLFDNLGKKPEPKK